MYIREKIKNLFSGRELIYALVGKSGTGKSFRARLLAEKYNMQAVIDDGLLISGGVIIAGKSAKWEDIYLKAIKTAIFENLEHRRQVMQAIEKNRIGRILLIGTSVKMVNKIAQRLGLKKIHKVIQIESISSKEEIETAQKARDSGQHVIPVPALEISRTLPHIFYDSFRIFVRKKIPLLGKTRVFEKSIVQPDFGKKNGRLSLSTNALRQMVYHCADELDSSIKIKKIGVRQSAKGYQLKIGLLLPRNSHVGIILENFHSYLLQNLEKYGGIIVQNADIEVEGLY